MNDQDNLQVQTSYRALRDQDNLLVNLQSNQVAIIAPTSGQPDFPVGGNYQWTKLSQYDYYRVETASSNAFSPTIENKIVKGTELVSTLNANSAYWIRVGAMQIQGSQPVETDITGVSISPSTATVVEGESLTLTGSVQGTGNYNQSGTWSRDTGTIPFTVSGNDITLSPADGSAGGQSQFTFEADGDATKTASRTITVTEASSDPVVENDSIDGDLIALNDIYDQTDGANWTNNTGWPIANTGAMGDAYGIDVYPAGHQLEGRVKTVDLDFNNLVNIELYTGAEPHPSGGTYPAGFPVVKNIDGDVIDVQISAGRGIGRALNTNDLFRERYSPLTGRALKSSIGNLQKCQLFDIRGNKLGGLLPNEIWTLSECEILVIGHNGQENSEIYNQSAPYPQKGNAMQNKFEGGIHPTIVQSMPKLKKLYCSENFFDGVEFPDFLWDIPFEHLCVSRNGWSGNLPDRDPVFKDTLDIFHCYGGNGFARRDTGSFNEISHPNAMKLTGPLRENVGNWSKLRELRWRWNGLTGSVPASYANFGSLLIFQVPPTVSGTYPSFVDNRSISSLHTVELSSVGFDGPLDPDLDYSNFSGKIEIRNNPLGGETPLGWRDSSDPRFPTGVQIWEFNDCGLSGSLATDISTMFRLRYITGHGNNLSSEFFQDFPNSNQLRWIALAGNDIFGTIRTTLGKIENNTFRSINLSDCNMSGYEAGAIKPVEFSGGNYVTGHRALRGFYLNGNNFAQAQLDQMILDVEALLVSRDGTAYDSVPFTLSIQNQQTGATPSNTTLINNAIANIESLGGTVLV